MLREEGNSVNHDLLWKIIRFGSRSKSEKEPNENLDYFLTFGNEITINAAFSIPKLSSINTKNTLNLLFITESMHSLRKSFVAKTSALYLFKLNIWFIKETIFVSTAFNNKIIASWKEEENKMKTEQEKSLVQMQIYTIES